VKLAAVKEQDANKYAGYLSQIINANNGCKDAVIQLGAVILRRNISVNVTDTSDLMNQENNANLWERLTDETRDFVKAQIIESLNNGVSVKRETMRKVCDLAVEVQGGMQEYQDDAIWQDLLNLVFSFVNDEMESKVDAGLKIFTGLFSYITEHLQAHT
jgi:hypothetical protein